MDKQIHTDAKKKVKNRLKVKLGTFSKVNQIFGTILGDRESILHIKNAAHDWKLPRGLLSAGSTAIKSHAEKYQAAAELDLMNEIKRDLYPPTVREKHLRLILNEAFLFNSN